MGQRIAHQRMLERVWLYMIEDDMEANTQDLFSHYLKYYSRTCDQRTMAQVLLRSGMFRRVGWESKGKRIPESSKMTANDLYTMLGISTSSLVAVWKPKPIEEIIKPYVEGKSTIKSLKNMPKFIRQKVDEYKGTSQ